MSVRKPKVKQTRMALMEINQKEEGRKVFLGHLMPTENNKNTVFLVDQPQLYVNIASYKIGRNRSRINNCCRCQSFHIKRMVTNGTKDFN